jgi:hypothetical protein
MNLLFVNLNGSVNYLVTEQNIAELSEDQKHIIVFPCTVTDLIKTLDGLRVAVKDSTRFVALDAYSLPELTAIHPDVLSHIVRDVTQQETQHEVLVLNASSMTLGGEVHDLSVLLGS